MINNQEKISEVLRTVEDEHGLVPAIGEAGGMNDVFLVTTDRSSSVPEAVLKIPMQTDWREYKVARYVDAAVSQSASEPPYEIPRYIASGGDLDHGHLDYLLLSYVPGEVLPQDKRNELSIVEHQEIGKAIGRFAVWGAKNFEKQLFRDMVESHCFTFPEWDTFFPYILQDISLEALRGYPNLIEIFQGIRKIKDAQYPGWFSDHYTHPIHGDLRLPNTALKGARGNRAPAGFFDFGTMRLGDFAEEARPLHLLHSSALDAFNSELDNADQAPVHPDAVKFWSEGRYIAGAICCKTEGMEDPDTFVYNARMLADLHPGEDWDELEVIEVHTSDDDQLISAGSS